MPLLLERNEDDSELYAASMKSYQYRNFDISESVVYSSLATFTFMFLVNDKHVWRDKTVP